MMFWTYKKDALKWRKLQQETKEKELARIFKCEFFAELTDGKIVSDFWFRSGHIGYDLDIDQKEKVVILGSKRLIAAFKDVCEIASQKGFDAKDGFYTSHTIKRLYMGEIEEVTE